MHLIAESSKQIEIPKDFYQQTTRILHTKFSSTFQSEKKSETFKQSGRNFRKRSARTHSFTSTDAFSRSKTESHCAEGLVTRGLKFRG